MYIGNAMKGNFAAVFAQLIVNGEAQGTLQRPQPLGCCVLMSGHLSLSLSLSIQFNSIQFNSIQFNLI